MSFAVELCMLGRVELCDVKSVIKAFIFSSFYFYEIKHLLALIKYRGVRSGHRQQLLLSLVDFSEVHYSSVSPKKL